MPTPQEIKLIDCGTGILPFIPSLFGVKNKTKFMNCGTGILPVLQSLLIMIQHMSLSSPTETPKKKNLLNLVFPH
jgi:hypothetical protein